MGAHTEIRKRIEWILKHDGKGVTTEPVSKNRKKYYIQFDNVFLTSIKEEKIKKLPHVLKVTFNNGEFESIYCDIKIYFDVRPSSIVLPFDKDYELFKAEKLINNTLLQRRAFKALKAIEHRLAIEPYEEFDFDINYLLEAAKDEIVLVL